MNKPADMNLFASPHRFTEPAGLSTSAVPLEPYNSQAFLEQERDKIFRRAWLVICREEELPSPGDFVTKTIDLTKSPLIVARQKDSSVRAFYNVCSHRGTRLVSQSSGSGSRFICPYHRWTYKNDGQLVGVTDESTFFGLDKANCALTQVACDTWNGFVFINLDPEPTVSLAEFLGDLGSYMGDIPFRYADTPVIIEAEIGANWKIVADAFLESYHIPFIHPNTIGSTFSSLDNPHSRLLDAEMFGDHIFVSMYGNPNFQLEERHKIDMIAQRMEGAGNVISANHSSELDQFLGHPAVNPTKSAGWSMDAVKLFPHTHINMGPGGFWVHQFWPLALDRTRHEIRFYMGEAATVRDRMQQELYLSRVLDIVAEDVCNMERTQAGVASGAKTHMQLQDNEVAIRHHVECVQRWISAGSAREAQAHD